MSRINRRITFWTALALGWMMSLFAAGASANARPGAAEAQEVRPVLVQLPAGTSVISGNDVGVRLTGHRGSDMVQGDLVVRINGQWFVVASTSGVLPAK